MNDVHSVGDKLINTIISSFIIWFLFLYILFLFLPVTLGRPESSFKIQFQSVEVVNVHVNG